MSKIRDEIARCLDSIPEDKLQDVLTFLNFLIWQDRYQCSQGDIDWLGSDLSSLGSYEPYEWQEGEPQEGFLVNFLPESGEIVILMD